MRSAFSVGLCSHDDGSCGLNLASGEGRKSAQSLFVTAVKNLASVSVSSAPNRSRARRTNGGSLENTRANFSLGEVVAGASADAKDLLPAPAAGVCSSDGVSLGDCSRNWPSAPVAMSANQALAIKIERRPRIDFLQNGGEV